jgi:hypothetical protein
MRGEELSRPSSALVQEVTSLTNLFYKRLVPKPANLQLQQNMKKSLILSLTLWRAAGLEG